MKKSTLIYAMNVVRKQQQFAAAVTGAVKRKEQMSYARGLTTMLELILTEAYNKPLKIDLFANELSDEDWAAVNDQLRIDFTTCLHNSDGEPIPKTEREVSLLFNQNVISAQEVLELIGRGVYEDDDRVICTTSKRADLFSSGATK